MDLNSRNQYPGSVKPATPNNEQPTGGYSPKMPLAKSKRGDNNKLMKWSRIVLTGSIAIVLIALVVFLIYGNYSINENKYINTSDMQAVFLNTGQVYFGNIKAVNSQYLDLVNIFYLQSTSPSGSTSSKAANSLVLIKLGCELHAPLDQMVINNSAVTFWENLSPAGQVSRAAATYWKEHPNGQKCTNQSTSPGASTSTTQPATPNTPSSSISTKP
ncbi:MAG: hypothetical protein M1554_02720 [Patescibacteria group bacterium]|jgi:hypothetical protein|nr:hypothetical protein [Patescibacteria group bacterium]